MPLLTNSILKWHAEFILFFSIDNPHLRDDSEILNDWGTIAMTLLLPLNQLISAYFASGRGINFIDAIPPHDELYWYQFLAIEAEIQKNDGITLKNFTQLVICIEKLSALDYKRGLVYRMISLQEDYDTQEYLSRDVLKRLALIYVSLGFPPGDFLPHLNHNFAERDLMRAPNAKYFDHVFSSMLTEQRDPRIFSLDLVISRPDDSFSHEPVTIRINFTAFDLLKYCSHKMEIEDPKFYFFNDYERDKWLKKVLHQEGYINSEGMLIPNKVFFYKDDLPYRVNKEFTARVYDLEGKLFRRHADRVKPLVLRRHNYQAHEDWVEKKFLARAMKVIKIRNQLGRFSPLDMLGLHYQALKNYVPTPGLPKFPQDEELKKISAFCLYAAAKVDIIFTKSTCILSDTVNARHLRCFSFAKMVREYLCANKTSIVLQIGTPIESGKEFSEHAFYLAINYIASTDQFVINIVNGGDGVTTYHYRDKSVREKEFTDVRFGLYHPVGLEPLDRKNVAHQEFLDHYIYRALSLKYGPKTLNIPKKDSDEEGEFETIFALTNLYLGLYDQVDYQFTGYRSKNFALLKRADSSGLTSYRAQLSGNCTNYNFMQALKIACSYDPIDFGIMLDAQLYAADQLIALLKVDASYEGRPSCDSDSGMAGSVDLLWVSEEARRPMSAAATPFLDSSGLPNIQYAPLEY